MTRRHAEIFLPFQKIEDCWRFIIAPLWNRHTVKPLPSWQFNEKNLSCWLESLIQLVSVVSDSVSKERVATKPGLAVGERRSIVLGT